ncbi:hypothetical protein PoB_007603800 [Plakobranchus ocellatus]|uniref:Uncharacterized protein n=1 Tax=Plakobranchus ocellatus TaxID=259542 RepID=A0AAV4DZ32_9GAST|nr:hypothetical protein PoB_007603800 [Plakobranchus ocellatus]
MLQLASGKAVTMVTNFAAVMEDPKRMKDPRVPILRGDKDSREVDVMRDTRCEGVATRKGVVEESLLTGESCQHNIDLKTGPLIIRARLNLFYQLTTSQS